MARHPIIGPGQALDTSKYFIICPNNLGSCYGSSGPSSPHPTTGKPYALQFPMVTVQDITHAAFMLLDHFGIGQLHAVVGSSLGGMTSLCAAALYPHRVRHLVSISAAAVSHPQSIAMRYAQRRCLLMDPNFNNGDYYRGPLPRRGMSLAREIATVTYRSGPEWEKRFGRKRLPVELRHNHPAQQLGLASATGSPYQTKEHGPKWSVRERRKVAAALSMSQQSNEEDDEEEDFDCIPTFEEDFLIESYLVHQGEKFCDEYDPNSFLFISKAMDLFSIAQPSPYPLPMLNSAFRLTTPPPICTISNRGADDRGQSTGLAERGQCIPGLPPPPPPITASPALEDERSAGRDAREFGGGRELTPSLLRACSQIRMPCLIMGAQSDRLFPIWQQKQMADLIRGNGNSCVTYYELDALYGHDTFLLDVVNIGAAVKGHLDQSKLWCGPSPPQ